MNRTWVFNDLHCGVARSGGTTPATADALKKFAHKKHGELLDLASDGDTVIINGDLTDKFNIELGDALELYATAYHWLNSHPTGGLVWCTGNHDLSKDSAKLGTVVFIGSLLKSIYPERFKLVTEPGPLTDDIYVIPHVANQDLFDLALSKVPEGVKYLLLHCNYDNTFAGQADHSLNIARSQAKALVKSGTTVILGHEHQGRTMMNDKVVITGNQFPTSVSDCLRHGDAQADGMKYALMLEGEDMELVPTWSPSDDDGGYVEVDWQALDGVDPDARKFIRVTGQAEPDQAADLVKKLSQLRQASSAYVITNAVKVGESQAPDEIGVSAEDIQAVNVIEILLTMLTEPQAQCVRNLLREEQQ